jgi:hypothetical protein
MDRRTWFASLFGGVAAILGYKTAQISSMGATEARLLNDLISSGEQATKKVNDLRDSGLVSDYDILTKWMGYSANDATEMVTRLKIQKLEEIKLQVLAQNPQLLGIGVPKNA